MVVMPDEALASMPTMADRLEAFRGRHPELTVVPDLVVDEDWVVDEVDVEARAAAARVARWATLIPPLFVEKNVSLDWVRGEHPNAYPALVAWSSTSTRSNLVLTGPIGTGKTGTALAACRPRIEVGVGFLYTKTVIALDLMRPGGEEGYMAQLTGVGLLVLDDVGVDKLTEWSAERLAAIVDVRWEHQRPTVVTTNLEPADLEAHIGERAYSRIADDAVAVRLTGKDRRRG